MNFKSILIAGLLAAALVALGFFASNGAGAKAAGAEGAGELFFPELFDSINNVNELAFKTTDAEFHIKRQESAWVLVEKDDFPVRVDEVRATLIALAELKLVEEKTSDPALHVKLGVQSVGANPEAEEQSKQLELLDEAGQSIASVIVGKARTGGKGNSFYLRRTSEMASWLVEGKLPSLPDNGEEWLDKKILELKRDDVCAVRTTHADGEVLTISKQDSETDFSVHELPAGRELSYDAVAGGIAGALQYMNFEDVRKAESFEALDSPVAVTSFWTRDGMRLSVKLWDQDDKTLAAFEASYDPDGAPSLVLGPTPEPAEGEAVASATPRPKDEVEAEIAELNARLSPWIYELPSYNKSNLTKRLDGLLKPLPEPEAEAPALDPGAPIDPDTLGGE